MDPHVEAVLIWSTAGPSELVRRFFSGRGLSVVEMRAGLLIAGPRSLMETALSLDLNQVEPTSLPVPEELQDHVASIAIPKLRRPT